VQAAAAAERARAEEQRRVETQVAAAAERAREEERERLAADAAAAAARARVEIQALETEARLATARLHEAERAIEEERHRLQADALIAADRAREEERARLEAEQRAREDQVASGKRAAGQRRRDRRRRGPDTTDADAPAPPPEPLVVSDQFAEFREDYDHVVPEVFRLMPLSAWARTESWRTVTESSETPERACDDLSELMAGFALSPHVAGVAYGRGCRIRRVRVPGNKPGGSDQTIIVSRRALEEVRAAHR
jgi:hypothetical protein